MMMRKMQYNRAKLFNLKGVSLCVIVLLTAPACATQNHNGDKPTFSTEKSGSALTQMIKVKKNFVQQNLPTPHVTGSVKKMIQGEDEALISAIISQDLKRQRGE